MLEFCLSVKKGAGGPNFRYMRLNNMYSSGLTYVSITELQVFEATTGVNLTQLPGVVASASSYYDDGTTAQKPANAIDNIIDSDPNHRWTSSGAGGAEWFMVDLLTPRLFDSIKIATHLQFGQQPNQFTIEGSNDGHNFFFLKSVLNPAYTAEYVPFEVYKS
jgi:F5/8 type C domain